MKKQKFMLFIFLTALLLVSCTSQSAINKQNDEQDSNQDGQNINSKSESNDEVPGVTDTEIILSDSASLTGNFANVSGNYIYSALAYFEKINQEEGGVHGRKIVYKPVDDGYVAERAVTIAKDIARSNEVLAAILPFGTANDIAKSKIYYENGVPYVAMGTSLQVANSNYDTQINPGTPYYYQLRAAIRYAVEELGAKKFSGLFWSTSDGKELEKAFKDELQKNSIEPGEIVSYEPGTTDFSGQMNVLKADNADFIAIYASTADAARAINAARRAGINANFIGPMILGDASLLELAGENAEGSIIGTPFKIMSEGDPDVQEYLDTIDKYAEKKVEPTLWSILGYSSAQIIVEGLKNAGVDLNRKTFIEGFEKLENYSSGIAAPISFEKGKHQGGTTAMVFKIEDGKFKAISDWITIEPVH